MASHEQKESHQPCSTPSAHREVTSLFDYTNVLPESPGFSPILPEFEEQLNSPSVFVDPRENFEVPPMQRYLSHIEQMQQRSDMGTQSAPKRKRSYSPLRPASPTFPRPEGIRKKNARFDIPPERTLLTIDGLIAECNDPEELKELKQQKRLLRNRQAA
jgi:hypothetical protein